MNVYKAKRRCIKVNEGQESKWECMNAYEG